MARLKSKVDNAEVTEKTATVTTNDRLETVVAGDRGYGLGIAGFITSFFASLVGLILSAVALRQSRAIGKRNPFALAGVIIGAAFTLLSIVIAVATAVIIGAAISHCRDNPNVRACNYSSNSSDVRMDPSMNHSGSRNTY